MFTIPVRGASFSFTSHSLDRVESTSPLFYCPDATLLLSLIIKGENDAPRNTLIHFFYSRGHGSALTKLD